MSKHQIIYVPMYLGTKGYNYGVRGQKLLGRGAYPVSQWNNPVTLSGDISIANIHGSLSWDNEGYYTDGRRGLTGKALIIAPTPEKELSEFLKFHWSLAKQIMNNTTELVVFGFAFNPYDQAVLSLFQSSASNLRRVLLIDITPKIDSAKALWPQATVESTLPMLQGNDFFTSWLQMEKISK